MKYVDLDTVLSTLFVLAYLILRKTILLISDPFPRINS